MFFVTIIAAIFEIKKERNMLNEKVPNWTLQFHVKKYVVLKLTLRNLALHEKWQEKEVNEKSSNLQCVKCICTVAWRHEALVHTEYVITQWELTRKWLLSLAGMDSKKVWESKELKEFPKTLESCAMTSDNKTVKPQSVWPTLFEWWLNDFFRFLPNEARCYLHMLE